MVLERGARTESGEANVTRHQAVASAPRSSAAVASIFEAVAARITTTLSAVRHEAPLAPERAPDLRPRR